jgi:hypothetical protein
MFLKKSQDSFTSRDSLLQFFSLTMTVAYLEPFLGSCITVVSKIVLERMKADKA